MKATIDPTNNLKIYYFDAFGYTVEFSRKHFAIWHTIKVKDIVYFQF